jgi:hypothetical protein
LRAPNRSCSLSSDPLWKTIRIRIYLTISQRDSEYYFPSRKAPCRSGSRVYLTGHKRDHSFVALYIWISVETFLIGISSAFEGERESNKRRK